MSGSRRWHVVPSLIVGVTLVSGIAAAQDAASPAAPGPADIEPRGAGDSAATVVASGDTRVMLTLRGREPGLRYSLYPVKPRGAEPIASCGEGCRLLLPAGRYRIEVAGPAGSDVHTGSDEVSIVRDTTLGVAPASRSGRRSGLAMGITGTVLIPVGLATLMVGLLIELLDSMESYDGYCDPADDVCYGEVTRKRDPVTPVIWAGLGMTAAGAVLTPVGWVRFARSRNPRFSELGNAGERATGPQNFWLGPRRIGQGYGIGTSFRF